MTAYQVARPLDPETHEALRASIERWGVIEPVVVDQYGDIIDGHHRSAIADELGVDYDVVERVVVDEAEGRALAVSLNVDRRQLTPELRREMSAALRAEGHTTRAIGAALGVDHSTIVRDLTAPTGAPAPKGAVPGVHCHDDDRQAMFDLAAEVDERGIGLHPFAVIAAKFDCAGKTVRKQLAQHPDRAQLPAKRYSRKGRATACLGSGAIAPPRGRGEWHVKRRHVDADRVITATVSTLAGLAQGLALIDDDDIRVADTEKRLAWTEALREPLRAITHLREVLR